MSSLEFLYFEMCETLSMSVCLDLRTALVWFSMCTSVYRGQWQRGQPLALHLPLLLQASLGLQDRVLKLSPSIDMAENTMHHSKQWKISYFNL